MQKQEFEERIERTVTDEQYKVIEEVYMWHTLLSAMENAGKDDKVNCPKGARDGGLIHIPDEAERKGLGTPAPSGSADTSPCSC